MIKDMTLRPGADQILSMPSVIKWAEKLKISLGSIRKDEFFQTFQKEENISFNSFLGINKIPSRRDEL